VPSIPFRPLCRISYPPVPNHGMIMAKQPNTVSATRTLQLTITASRDRCAPLACSQAGHIGAPTDGTICGAGRPNGSTPTGPRPVAVGHGHSWQASAGGGGCCRVSSTMMIHIRHMCGLKCIMRASHGAWPQCVLDAFSKGGYCPNSAACDTGAIVCCAT
jgi:hypothetical protein